MYALHKNFTIIYREIDNHIVVTSIATQDNRSCMYGEREYPSIRDVILDIDSGKFDQ